MEYTEYEFVGACEYIKKEVALRLGYQLDEYYTDNPFFVYSKNGKLDTGMLYMGEENKRYVQPRLIKKLYDIKQAKEKFPELFL